MHLRPLMMFPNSAPTHPSRWTALQKLSSDKVGMRYYDIQPGWPRNFLKSYIPQTKDRTCVARVTEVIHPHKPRKVPKLYPANTPNQLGTTLCTPLSSPIRATCPTHLILLILPPAQHWVRYTDHSAPDYVISPFPCHLFPLRPKYSPQHPILKQPQSTFLPQCQRPSFTPIQNNG
jgi:hypothetical protein